MLRKSYLLIGSIIFCLLFSFNAKAATSLIYTNANDDDGYNVQIQANTYTSLSADEIYSKDNSPKYWYKWNISQNIIIRELRKGRYYNGRLSFWVIDNVSLGSRNNVTLQNTEVTNGLYCFIDSVSADRFRVVVIFDNYYATDTAVGLPTIDLEYRYTTDTPADDPSLSTRTTLSISWISGLKSYEFASPEGFAGMLFDMTISAIANAQEFDDIVSILSAIRSENYNYYTNIITSLSQLHIDNTQLHGDLTNILNELDLDFQAVQTVLDLFPSYRTQVLQYWQQLLEMNAAQSSAAAEMEQEYGNKETQSGQLISDLGNLNLPQVDADDFNILGNVNSNSKANFFGLIGLITNNSLITTILIIIVTGAIVGYALYGKK